MVQVNLTPEELRNGQMRRRRRRLWILTLAAAVTTGGCWAAIRYFDYRRENQAAHIIARKYQDLQQSINSLSLVRNQLDLWQDRIALLNELNQYPDFVGVTDYLSRHSPQLIYLEQMKFWRPEKTAASGPPRPEAQAKAAHMFVLKNEADNAAPEAAGMNTAVIMVSLKGRSVNYQAVADYLQMLSSADIITGARLKYSRRQSAAAAEGVEVVDFEIEARLAPMLSPGFLQN